METKPPCITHNVWRKHAASPTIIYQMTAETAKRVPEVRIKYLRRQLKRRRHVKNVVAATPQLLQLIVSMERGQHAYELRNDTLEELQQLENQYAQLKAARKSAA